jgi:hypothetical protein
VPGLRSRSERRLGPVARSADTAVVFESLDFVYVPTEDVGASARRYVEELGGGLVWKVRGMGTVVACLRVSSEGPAILLSGHLEGETPILVYRVAITRRRSRECEPPGSTTSASSKSHTGPVRASAAGGHLLAVYQLIQSGADQFFAGRVDD